MVKELEVPTKSSSNKGVMLCLFIVLITMSYCSYSIYRGFADFPEWAKKEVVYTRYADLIASIESEIKHADSLYDLAAKLEKLPYASEIQYMEIEHVPGKSEEDDDPFAEEEELVVIDDEASSHNHFLSDSVGYGNRNGLDTVVVLLEVGHLQNVNHVLFHLRYEAQE